MKKYMRVRADVDLTAIHNNLALVKRRISSNTKLFAVIKADGYGHGAKQIAKYCNDLIDGYAVAVVEEGVDLRNSGFNKPILLLGYTHPLQYNQIIEYDMMPAVFSYQMAKALSEKAGQLNKKIKIHIKLDTGMSRIGFADNEESVRIIKEISLLPNIEINGIFSHLARADEKDKTFAKTQYDRFITFTIKLEQQGIKIPNRHISNSAAIMELPEMNLEMVRCGIITYGLYPSAEMDKKNFSLEPAMQWKSAVSYVKTVPKGTPIGYGGTYITDRETVVATIPVGYADGYPRTLSNKGFVLIKGEKAPIIGRVCMDQFMVDVSHIKGVVTGDTVTLMGKDGKEEISCDCVADLAGSFNYEFVCDIGKRVPRVYYYNGKVVDTVQLVGNE
ncbi:MAG: alanine racemase [Oscillospiraceae bacterium]|nr:alanine racemase [Oscillospiraceae bacterium]